MADQLEQWVIDYLADICDEEQITLSGKDCILAASLTVMARSRNGCVNLPEEGVSNLVVIVTEISSFLMRVQVPL